MEASPREQLPRGPRSGESDKGEARSNVTRGGWVPTGTAASRRTAHEARGTDRGKNTRSAILAAARALFEEHGYVDVSIEDIVTRLGVSRGTFYTYFSTKSDVFRELSSQVREEIDTAVSARREGGNVGVIGALTNSNRRYIEVYKANARMYGLIEQVATMDPEVHRQRLESRRANVERVASTITRWQRRGLADLSIDPLTTASVLVSLTSNSCYWWFVGGDEAGCPDDPVVAITDIWVRATGLRDR
ncbi:TetR/AcrR family transcriptional regulator [Nocardia sp. NPDC059236]